MDKPKWIKLEKGIRFWVHPSRKWKPGNSAVAKRDRYLGIRFMVHGQAIESGIGWESEGNTVSDARKRLQEFKRNAKEADGKPVKMSEYYSEKATRNRQNISIKDLIEQHYLAYSKGLKSDGQYKKENEHCQKWLIPTIGKNRVKDMMDAGMNLPLVLRKSMADAGKSNRMIEHCLFTLNQVFQYAVKMGLVSGKMDMSDAKRNLAINNSRQRFLTRDEAVKLIQLVRERDEQLALMAEFSLLTACRWGELVSIQWQCVNLESKSILLMDTKNKSDRNLYLTDRACEIIRKQPAGQPGDAVFRNADGKPYERLPRTWKAALSESGLNTGITDNRMKICWHSLRHSAASWLAIGGTDLFKVARILGHKDLRMTQRYSHLSEQSLRDAVEKVMQ